MRNVQLKHIFSQQFEKSRTHTIFVRKFQKCPTQQCGHKRMGMQLYGQNILCYQMTSMIYSAPQARKKSNY